jgi:hypothetical protein
MKSAISSTIFLVLASIAYSVEFQLSLVNAIPMTNVTPRFDMSISGTTLFYTEFDGSNNFRLTTFLFDISNPDNPVESGYFYHNLMNVDQVIVNGDYVYVSGRDAQTYGFFVYQIEGNETADVCDGPSSFTLNPAYPNPFNPSTSIDFTLEQTDNVKLTIHNINGQQVAVLQNGLMERGDHTVDFTASGLASGVYTYTLEVGGFKQTKSFTLVK